MTNLLDRKLNGPWRITFDTNPDTCNLKCMMCEERSQYRKQKNGKNRVMEFKIIEDAIKNAVGHGLCEIIPSTMGEPLLYPDMRRLIELIKKYKLKMNLTTNGTFPKMGAIAWGELILPIGSDVKISINGANRVTAEGIMKGLSFEKQLSNINDFLKVRDQIVKDGINNPTITFQVTYMERNLEDLQNLLKIAIDMGIDRFKGHHLWITWPELEEESLLKDRESRKRWNSVVRQLTDISENGRKIKLDNVYPVPIKPSENRLPLDWICPFLGREAWIAWDGTFNVCCSPDILRKSLGYFGNANNDNFIQLWEDEKYNRLLSGWGKYEVCRKCNMRKPGKDLGGG